VRLLYPADETEDGNDSSCVLQVRSGRASLLLPGDIGAAVERRLVARAGPALQSDVLVAAHHGSATSTSASFLDAVRPRMVLYSSGYANRFRFPAAAVQKRVAGRGIAALDTARAGAIELTLRPSGEIIGPVLHRQRADRLWRHHPQP